MNIAIARLGSLLEFAERSAQLRMTPTRTVAQHRQFRAFEAQLTGLPGLSFDVDDDHWLHIERLFERPAPAVEHPGLGAWIKPGADPDTAPELKSSISLSEFKSLVGEGRDTGTLQGSGAAVPDTGRMAFEDFPDHESIRTQLEAYTAASWAKWAAEESPRRKTIRLYSQLFSLYQQLQGSLGDTPLELVWGVGVCVLSDALGEIRYPLLSQPVDLSLNEADMSLDIRPRRIDPSLEVHAFEERANVGVPSVVALAKEQLSDTELNPFKSSSFKAVLQAAATHLDPNGDFWPERTTAQDRSVPASNDHLVVTDTWVIFARARTNNLFIQDLQRFRSQLAADVELPGAVASLVTEPADTHQQDSLPAFRGRSRVSGHANVPEDDSASAQELYFPLPYNDEQVQIIQRLEIHDGVVAQGPPGTGKTHTIANVICHELAQGRRVLITSMKEPALSVLREKIPEQVRPLAISLLTNEAEGMRQFEYAIDKVATEIQSISPPEYRAEIDQLEERLDSLHAERLKTDREISGWAQMQLEPFTVDDEVIHPADAAKRVAARGEAFAWLSDALTIDNTCKARFSEDEVGQLREARRALQGSLQYLRERLPSPEQFPSAEKLHQVHQDLAHSAELRRRETAGEIPPLLNTEQPTFERAELLSKRVDQLGRRLRALRDDPSPWALEVLDWLRRRPDPKLVNSLRRLVNRIAGTLTDRDKFVTKPVTAPAHLERNKAARQAISNLAQGRKAFGLSGLFARGEEKRLLAAIEILGDAPKSPKDWAHVGEYLSMLRKSRSYLARWNALAVEIPLPRLDPSAGQPAKMLATAIERYRRVEAILKLQRQVTEQLVRLLPTWSPATRIAQEAALLEEADAILAHHRTRYRLDRARSVKQSIIDTLSGYTGDITDRIRQFLESSLGSTAVSVADFQTRWSALMDELQKLHALRPELATVERVTALIESSGAKRWAEALRRVPPEGACDGLLPEHWSEAWRLRRMATYLDATDGHAELKHLFEHRLQIENQLAKTYQQLVSKRTWLKLTENATPTVKAALTAFRKAIHKLGKGTGKRAGRYRQDARTAAEHASAAIPCWIMPHYRVSEALPAVLGQFDLVVIDEASQSDLTALPAILRAKKVLIVGDDKQVSPDGVGMDEGRIKALMDELLANQVELYRPQMSPDRSVYDLFGVAFSHSCVMLREHFRCAPPIIEYSKREFYHHELRPLRLPKTSERLDPALIDVYVEDGYREGKVNPAEATFITEEISRIAANPDMATRTVGVVSLLGPEQAQLIMARLNEEIGEEAVTRHAIACGDARTFQGKERDIMFLSMVATPEQAVALTGLTYEQRFNVAASRARDRMYLVRSLELEALSAKDHLRKALIEHFQAPFKRTAPDVEDPGALCESAFAREVYEILVSRGYRVHPQVHVGTYHIDLLVEGDNDRRLAIACDGDQYYGPGQWDHDMQRQRVLERAGWEFWRCFAATFALRKAEVTQELIEVLTQRGIQPVDRRGASRPPIVESRRIQTLRQSLEDTRQAAHAVGVNARLETNRIDSDAPVQRRSTPTG